jgi:hypothetical protein
MDTFFEALSQHAFLQTAVATALLASIGCGVMGTYVVVKRIAFLAGGIAHSVLGGMGAAVYFGLDPLHGALPAAVAAALLIGWVRLHWRAQEDTLISALWAIGMAILQKQPLGQVNQRNVKLGCNTITDAGVYTFRIIDAGKTEYVPARYTFVYENRDGEWLIAHHHSSLMPVS